MKREYYSSPLVVYLFASKICDCQFFRDHVTVIQSPSAHSRIFLNAQIFLCGFKNFHVHTSLAHSLSVRQLICKAIFGSGENFIANRLQ